MEGALLQHDKDVAFEWFYSVLLDDSSMSGTPKHSWAIIDKRSSQLLLTEKMAKLDPSTLSEAGYQCFASYFTAVGCLSLIMPCHELEPNIMFALAVVTDFMRFCLQLAADKQTSADPGKELDLPGEQVYTECISHVCSTENLSCEPCLSAFLAPTAVLESLLHMVMHHTKFCWFSCRY